MSNCYETCRFVKRLHTEATELQKTYDATLLIASGTRALLAMDDETRGQMVEMFGSQRSAVLHLGDPKHTLEDVIDIVSDGSKDRYRSNQRRLELTIASVHDIAAEAVGSCANKGPLEVSNGDSESLLCISRYVIALQSESTPT